MLRSLIELAIRPSRSMDSILNVSVDAREISVQLYRPDEQRILWEKKWLVTEPQFLEGFDSIKESWEENIVRELSHLVGAAAPYISVILPDPMFTHVSIAIEELPAKRDVVEALVRMRMQEEYYLDTENMSLDIRAVDTGNMLSVFCVSNALLETIDKSFARQNLFVASYQPRSLHAFAKVLGPNNYGRFFMQADDYYSYGYVGRDLNTLLLQSEFVSEANYKQLQAFYNRACRDFISSGISQAGKESNTIYWLGRDKVEIAEENWGGFKCEVVGNRRNMESIL